MRPASRFRIAAFGLGALAAAAPSLLAQVVLPPSGPVVSLPPFLVQSAHGPPWRYTRLPGFEILSHWPDSKTEPFVQQLAATKQLFDTILPPEFQVQLSAPTAYLLVPDVMTDALSGSLVAQVLAHAPKTAAASEGRPTEVRFLPNMMLWDRDALAVFGLQPTREAEGRQLVFSYDRVLRGLERRVPALPHWFVDGFCELYGGMAFTPTTAATGQAWWLSPAKTSALAKDPESPRQLLPLAELFENPPMGGRDETDAHAALRTEEASLFIRWALDGEGHPRRAALWRLVTAASTGPVTEPQFQELFGEDFVSALNDLSDYLPWAVSHSLRVTAEQAPADVEVRLRDATPAEVGRIKGDWERLEMDHVAVQFPELVPKYREHASATLDFAYSEDKADPGLLGIMGLFDLDCGIPDRAQPLLAAAAAGRVVRPRVYFELARMELADAIKTPAGVPPPRLDSAKLVDLLGLLDQARAQKPALAEVYGLAFEVWQAASAQPMPNQLQVFRESAQLFPENPALMYEAALMLARGGFLVDASQILQQGLSTPVGSSPLHTRMVNLQGALASALRGHDSASGVSSSPVQSP
jgi:hypothetical protein